jgi:cell division septation protein DedD
MMWPSELRAPDRTAEPMVAAPRPPVPAAIAGPRPPSAGFPPAATASDATPAAASTPAPSLASAPAPEAAPAPSLAPEVITARPAISAPRQPPAPARPAPAAEEVALATPASAPARPRIEPTTVSRALVARPATAPGWWIQVGAYRSASAAGRVAVQVHGEILVVAKPDDRESPLLRVRVGPFADRAEAQARLHDLEAQGWKAFLSQ